MPDHTARLFSQEKAQALAWINRYARSGFVCPVCGSKNWLISDHVTQAPRFAKDFLEGGTATYPLILFISNPCGFVMPFSSHLMGIPAPPPPPPISPPLAPNPLQKDY